MVVTGGGVLTPPTTPGLTIDSSDWDFSVGSDAPDEWVGYVSNSTDNDSNVIVDAICVSPTDFVLSEGASALQARAARR
jgi:hypothetical protein